MDLSKRIEKIMKENSSSPAEFSEKTGIQRPALSHIFSGRNKPSLDMIIKILTKFPDTDADWLITGKEKPPSPPLLENNKLKEPVEKTKPLDVQSIRETEKIQDTKTEEIRRTERIVIFYSDGTFREFKPS